jgi:competence protein ComEC
VRFEWLHPGRDLPLADNDRSCVLLVRAGGHTVLLTGDVERGAEAELVASGMLPRIDVLVVPHHGSRTSSTSALVAATRPRWALVAAGYRNRWGFPKPEIVARWGEAGAEVLVSSATGAIEFDVYPDRPLAAPQLWRPSHRRPWRDP